MQKEFGPRPTAAQQIQFALNELRGRPEGARVNAAKTPEELTDLQLEFERPGIPNREARLATTREYMLNPPKPGAAGRATGGAVIDKTADAGFGQKFGPLEQPQGMVIHHTAGGKSVDDVIATFKKTNFPAQFVIDRDGKIYQTLPDGYRGQHVRDSWGPLGAGKGNANLEGIEIIADNDGDVLPVQQQAAARLVAMRAQKYGYDPKTSVYGHGELNPGHKQADEGMSTVTRIRNGSLPMRAAASTPPATPVATGTSTPAPPAPGAGGDGKPEPVVEPDADLGGGMPAAAPAAPAPAEKPAPDWAGMATRLRESNLPAGAKAKAMQIIENDKRMYEFGTAEYKTKYNASAQAAVEQRTDEIVQATVRSDDPAAHAKAQTDLAAIVKWGVDSGAVSANEAYRFEREAKAKLITGRAQYLNATGKPEEALAYIQQNEAALPAATFQQQVQSLQGKAEEAQGTRFARDLRVGEPGYVPAPTPGMLPGGPADFPTPLARSPYQQRLQAIEDSDLPDRAKKTARERIVSEHQTQIVGQGQAASDLNAAIKSGQASRLDVEQAYREERISPDARTTLNNKFDKIEADRLAGAQAMLKVENAGRGGAPLNPKSPEDKKALNYHFEQVAAAQEQANAAKRAQGLPVPDATANAIELLGQIRVDPREVQRRDPRQSAFRRPGAHRRGGRHRRSTAQPQTATDQRDRRRGRSARGDAGAYLCRRRGAARGGSAAGNRGTQGQQDRTRGPRRELRQRARRHAKRAARR